MLGSDKLDRDIIRFVDILIIIGFVLCIFMTFFLPLQFHIEFVLIQTLLK